MMKVSGKKNETMTNPAEATIQQRRHLNYSSSKALATRAYHTALSVATHVALERAPIK